MTAPRTMPMAFSPNPECGGPAAAVRSWEVTLIRRASPRQRPRVVGCLRFDADDAAAAHKIADDGLAARSDGDPHWALGPLRPLGPSMPGTHPFRVTFTMWRDGENGFVCEDVLSLTQWATDSGSARRLAITEAQGDPLYQGSWRVGEVCRLDDPGGAAPGRTSMSRPSSGERPVVRSPRRDANVRTVSRITRAVAALAVLGTAAVGGLAAAGTDTTSPSATAVAGASTSPDAGSAYPADAQVSRSRSDNLASPPRSPVASVQAPAATSGGSQSK